VTVLHGYGPAEAEIDGQPCTGTFGLSYYAEAAEAGGAVQLRCEDGSVLGLSLSVTDQYERAGVWLADITVASGFYRAG
jgi:hypothetical protein